MPAKLIVPGPLTNGPFTFARARSLGVSEKVLRGQRFIRLFPRVHVLAAHDMTTADWIAAARLALPARAQLSHVSRIHQLGLDFLDATPIHFTIFGELHLDLDGIMLHRTKVLPALDEIGVTPAVAFIQLCASARLIDVIKVGDWLLHHRHMTILEVTGLARHQPWRPGASEVRKVLPYLDAGARSLKESETRAVLVFGGLPTPEVNKNVHDVGGTFLGCGDLVYRLWKVLVEYEGRQHLLAVDQWNRDIDRYGGFRQENWRYVQVTNEKLNTPKKLVSEVYRQLVQGGYRGPAPVFRDRWEGLFRPLCPQRTNGGESASSLKFELDANSPP